MPAVKVLVVDDEKKIVDIVKAYLEKENFQVIEAYSGDRIIKIVETEYPDLVILDLMLPGLSGLDVCRELRKTSNVPVIMLTARDEVADKIVGLELGADDYITKPFNPNELVSRVRSVLRRSSISATNKKIMKIKGLLIDVEKRLVYSDDKKIDLTATEFDLLKTLAANPGRVFSRMQLLDSIQGEAYEGYERTIDSHIKNLRKKVEPNPEMPSYIITVYGVGYKIEDNSKCEA
jgi:two-component system, OmpR family, response regulator